MLDFGRSKKVTLIIFHWNLNYLSFEIVTRISKLRYLPFFNLSALSAVLDEINARNYATLCTIGNKMGFIPGEIFVRGFVFRKIEIQKILFSRRDLLRSNKVECDSKLFCFNKFLCETNIFRVMSIRKIFRISISQKTKRLTEILKGMNPILFPILHNVA